MKKIVFFCLALLMMMGILSGCTSKPKPEEALKAFLEISQTDEETEYRDYFDADIEYFETQESEVPEENPIMTQEIQDRMTELFIKFTYEIKSVEKSEDGNSALISVELVTVDMSEIFSKYITALIAKAVELSQNGGTEEELMALVGPIFLESMVDAKIDKISTVTVRMTYDKENKKWWIKGGEANVSFVDALCGGIITTMKEYETMFPTE